VKSTTSVNVVDVTANCRPSRPGQVHGQANPACMIFDPSQEANADGRQYNVDMRICRWSADDGELKPYNI